MAFWVPCKRGNIPSGAIQGGYEANGRPLYIAKALNPVTNTWVPGKAGRHLRNGCHYSYACEELTAEHYEVLVYDETSQKVLEWIECFDGEIPNRRNAVCTCEAEGLFVGRVYHSGAMIPGKLDKLNGCLYIPYRNKELNFKTYDILYIRD